MLRCVGHAQMCLWWTHKAHFNRWANEWTQHPLCLQWSERHRHFVQSDSIGFHKYFELELSYMHPVLSAAWALSVENHLRSPMYWIRSGYNGMNVDTNLNLSHLKRLLTKAATARVHLTDDHSVYLKNVSQSSLRSWSSLRIWDDRRAIAALQGMPQVLGNGSLLQQLMAPSAFAGARPQSLEMCARSNGGHLWWRTVNYAHWLFKYMSKSVINVFIIIPPFLSLLSKGDILALHPSVPRVHERKHSSRATNDCNMRAYAYCSHWFYVP